MKKQMVKQLVLLSGKGGTGKTCLSAGLIHLSSQSMIKGVYVDADVDAANLALVMEAKQQESYPFTGGKLAAIDSDKCIRCGICLKTCRFDAIQEPKFKQVPYLVDPLMCDGCAACVYTCPESAIQMTAQQDGEWYHSVSPFGHLFHAELFPAAENTGKLVTTIKQNAKLFSEDHHLSLMIIDGPPGIGCPVISSSAGADLALLVTETGVSSLHDLERIIQTLQHFNIRTLVCINKADLFYEGTKAIYELAKTYDCRVIGEIPFDYAIPQAMNQGKAVTRFSPQSPASLAIHRVWNQIKITLFGKVYSQ